METGRIHLSLSVSRTKMAAMVLGIVAAVHPVAAQQNAAHALELAKTAMGSAAQVPRLIGVRVDESLDAELWELQFDDASVPGGRRLVSFRDGKYQKNWPGTTWPFGNAPFQEIPAEDLGLALITMRRTSAALALGAGLKPASMTYVLIRRGPNVRTQWEVFFLDVNKRVLGTTLFSAKDGAVLRSEWTRSSESKPPPAPQTAPGQ